MTSVARQDAWEDARRTRLSVGTAVGATSVTVTAGGLASWGPVVHGKFSVVVDRGSAFEEHCYGAAIAGDQITGLTQVDGTPGLLYAHEPAVTVEHGLLAEHVDTANELLSMPTAAGQFLQSTAADTWGATAAPTLTDFTNAPHDHGDADDGGALASGIALTSPVITGGGGTLILPQGAAPSQTAEGSAVWDTDDNLLTVGDGAGRKTMVDTDSVQTLTSKTLTSPLIVNFVNAQHDHGDADDGGLLSTAAPSASAVADSSVTGTATTYSRTDHRHAREAFGAVTAATQTAASANGSATTVARSDHDHGWPVEAPRGELFTVTETLGLSESSPGTETVLWSTTLDCGTSRRIRQDVTVLLNTDTAGDLVRMRIRNGLTTAGAEVGRGQRKLTTLGGNGQETLTFFALGTFTGSQDFCVTLERAAGTGTISTIASAAAPSLWSIEDRGEG